MRDRFYEGESGQSPDLMTASRPSITRWSVETMLKLHKDLPKAKTPHEQESLNRTIEATDKQIDALVYELYGLTDEEIRVVEGKQK